MICSLCLSLVCCNSLISDSLSDRIFAISFILSCTLDSVRLIRFSNAVTSSLCCDFSFEYFDFKSVNVFSRSDICPSLILFAVVSDEI
eukprot:UN03008